MKMKMKKTKSNFVKLPLIVAISTIGLMGGVTSHVKKFYVTPLKTASFSFDNIDLVSGVMKETVVDFGIKSKMPFSRTYLSSEKRKGLALGNFRHNFDKKINAKVPLGG